MKKYAYHRDPAVGFKAKKEEPTIHKTKSKWTIKSKDIYRVIKQDKEKYSWRTRKEIFPANIEHVCKNCKTSFVAHRSRPGVYCSRKCRYSK